MRHIFIALTMVVTLLSDCSANSIDDLDKKENESTFPVDGTLISVTEDNFQ